MASDIEHHVEIWTGELPPNEDRIRRLLSEEGLSGYRWSNSPGDTYARHSHPFLKVIYVIQGSITFILPEIEKQVTLNAGDRLELPRDMAHEAKVGPQGVICIEAHRQ
jgi:quercetin dioxygenase-like cupin family protein